MTVDWKRPAWLRGSTALLRGAIVAALALSTVVAVGADAGGSAACRQRTLVLSAMPIELGPLLAQTKVERTVTDDGHHYFVGRLRGHDVVLTLTGIGPVNADNNTRKALTLFRCGGRSGIDSVVFSGVSGGDFIGNVIVPTRWTLDAGKHFSPVDPKMLAAARRTAHTDVPLEQKAPAGDPLCQCVTDPDTVSTVAVTHKPRIEVGGDGETTDPFGGRALGCAPGGGDVFGCEPCVLQTDPDTAGHFVDSAVPFVDPDFFRNYSSGTGSGHYVAEDEETAAVAKVAAARHLPFLGFRAVSDGKGDPLGLPGFPVQFFYYRQLAADNAALTTMAFLANWHGA